jgi:hypothetical protein
VAKGENSIHNNAAKAVNKPKAKPRGKAFPKGHTMGFQKGQSGNPGGAPKGERFQTIFARYAEMSANDAAKLAALAVSHPEALGELPFMHVLVLRTMAAYHSEPNASMLREMLDRVEGKVKDEIDHNVKGNLTVTIEDAIAKIYGDDASPGDGE